MRRGIIILTLWLISLLAQAQSISALWQQVPGYRPLTVDKQQEVSLWLDEQTAKKVGTVILLPDWGELPTSDDAIEPLRKMLPKWGWQTIAITPPVPVKRQLIIANDDPKAVDAYQQKLLDTLDALDKQRKERFGYQVIVAQGVMAAWILRIYQQKQRPMPDALVIIDSYFPNEKFNQAIAQELAQLTCPVYDIYFRSANNWALSGVKARRIAMQRVQKLDYRQSELQSAPYLATSGQQLAKQLYGWFSALGWN
ncbi:DUF3530 family protein [Celerinatantimonas yamalensis]|uniref:DUF3530 family protein n=1 Tax=Celerinatantimonas yamalensis TaxID=559956 RepID=A0ABW9GAW5_9GAMM